MGPFCPRLRAVHAPGDLQPADHHPPSPSPAPSADPEHRKFLGQFILAI